MKKWLVYVLGIITGIVLTFVFAFFYNLSNNSGILGLNLFDEPGDYMEYSEFEVLQVLPSGCALAYADNSYSAVVLMMPDENNPYYDNQKIELKSNQSALRVGNYNYTNKMGRDMTVPAVEIVDGPDRPESKSATASGITLFDAPGECVSLKNFEVQTVLDSGDAIALEINNTIGGHVFTSELEVLILAEEGRNFYNNQIVKAPKGKRAMQIGNYKYQRYGETKVIPIVAFR